MPVLLTPELQDAWLNSATSPLQEVVGTAPNVEIQAWEVSPAVGNVKNNNADLTTNQTLF
jgi:putative SOS response-associated peptidase YedK